MTPGAIRFLAALARDPHATGAIAPSSRVLAAAMIRALGPRPRGSTVVELGPGDGVFTAALARVHQGPILAIEQDLHFVTACRRRVPSATVVHGCATALGHHLANRAIPPTSVAGVVSGLPFLSLPATVREGVFAALTTVLAPGRPWVQFTYNQAPWCHFRLPGFRLDATTRVWWNLPPAVVLHLVRSGS